jgi:hypothetical protein
MTTLHNHIARCAFGGPLAPMSFMICFFKEPRSCQDLHGTMQEVECSHQSAGLIEDGEP